MRSRIAIFAATSGHSGADRVIRNPALGQAASQPVLGDGRLGAGRHRKRLRLWRRVLKRAQGLSAVSRGVAEDFAEVMGFSGLQ